MREIGQQETFGHYLVADELFLHRRQVSEVRKREEMRWDDVR